MICDKTSLSACVARFTTCWPLPAIHMAVQHLQYEHSDTLLSISMFEQALEKPPLTASSLQSMPREESPAMLHMMAKYVGCWCCSDAGPACKQQEALTSA